MRRRPPRSTRTVTRFPYTTLFRSQEDVRVVLRQPGQNGDDPSFHEVVVSDRFRRLTPDELLAVAGQSGEVTRHTFADAGRHFGKRPGIGELTEASDVEAVAELPDIDRYVHQILVDAPGENAEHAIDRKSTR